MSQYQYDRLLSVVPKGFSQQSSFLRQLRLRPHGRQSQITDTRNGTTAYAFNNADLATRVTTLGRRREPSNNSHLLQQPFAGDQQCRSRRGFDTFSFIQPEGEKNAWRTHMPRRLLIRLRWSRQNHDELEQLCFSAGGRVTAWNYNANADGSTASATTLASARITHAPGGRLATRASAGGFGTTYTYGFNDGTAGDQFSELVHVSASPLSTARLSHQPTVTTAVGDCSPLIATAGPLPTHTTAHRRSFPKPTTAAHLIPGR